MPLFPYRRFRLESPLPPAEVMARLAAAVEPVRWVRWPFEPPGRPFEGEVGPNEFRVTRVIRYRNSFRPDIEGRVVWTPDGSVIEGTAALQLWAAAFMSVWLACAGLAVVGCLWMFVRDGLAGDWRPILFAPVGLFVFGWAMTTGGFTVEARRALALLREIAGG
ncbi:MAG: hypothetical protein K2X82_18950 [Gemmataceae bacterium]|nr:hypothetical protein [Gemmataceae bacterium]